jgi:hypothetical protein
MQSTTQSRHPKRKKSKWEKIGGSRLTGLLRYRPSGRYYARVCSRGKIYRESLKTKDPEFAERKLAGFKRRLDRTEPRFGRITLVCSLEDYYFPTLRGSTPVP